MRYMKQNDFQDRSFSAAWVLPHSDNNRVKRKKQEDHSCGGQYCIKTVVELLVASLVRSDTCFLLLEIWHISSHGKGKTIPAGLCSINGTSAVPGHRVWHLPHCSIAKKDVPTCTHCLGHAARNMRSRIQSFGHLRVSCIIFCLATQIIFGVVLSMCMCTWNKISRT